MVLPIVTKVFRKDFAQYLELRATYHAWRTFSRTVAEGKFKTKVILFSENEIVLNISLHIAVI